MISMRMASCSSPRPETRKLSGDSVSSTRMPGLSLRSFSRRSRSCGEVTKRPSLPANGETFDEKSIDTVGSSIRMSGSATGFSTRSEEHTSELQSPCNLVCRLLLEKKKKKKNKDTSQVEVLSCA